MTLRDGGLERPWAMGPGTLRPRERAGNWRLRDLGGVGQTAPGSLSDSLPPPRPPTSSPKGAEVQTPRLRGLQTVVEETEGH